MCLLVNMCEKFLQGRCWFFLLFFFLRRERNNGLKWQKGAKKIISPTSSPRVGEYGSLRGEEYCWVYWGVRVRCPCSASGRPLPVAYPLFPGWASLGRTVHLIISTSFDMALYGCNRHTQDIHNYLVWLRKFRLNSKELCLLLCLFLWGHYNLINYDYHHLNLIIHPF